MVDARKAGNNASAETREWIPDHGPLAGMGTIEDVGWENLHFCPVVPKMVSTRLWRNNYWQFMADAIMSKKPCHTNVIHGGSDVGWDSCVTHSVARSVSTFSSKSGVQTTKQTIADRGKFVIYKTH